MSKLYITNRQNFAEHMIDDSVFIAFAGDSPVMSGDAHYHFVPDRDFLYLTGIDKPKMILIMQKIGGKLTETLLLERFDEVQAKWVGAVMTKEEATKISGIEKFKTLEDLDAVVQGLFMRMGINNVYLDLNSLFWNSGASPAQKFAAELREKCPCMNFHNANDIIRKLRPYKSAEEVNCLKKAIDITKAGLNRVMKNMRAGMYEYQLEAHFDFELKSNGTGHGFTTIAASGKNATVLHYVENNTKIEDGELVLLDLGARWNWYSADISRTYPVNGKFTERQKLLYNIVLEANEKVIAAIKPGLPFEELNKIVLDHYEVELKKINLIKDRNEISKYYYHGVSHGLGLDTHDLSPGRSYKLKEGMVLTVEPGLYIEEEGIGIRIEDDVFVTANGAEVLSKDLIKTVDDIEAFMSM